MTTTTANLSFDYSKPFGPLTSSYGDVVCSAGAKSVGFTGKSSAPGYTHFVALSPLNAEADVHVWSLKLSGMFFDYGFNAIAIMIMRPDRPIFLDRAIREDVKIDSQDIAPYSTTTVTCVLAGSVLTLYTTDGRPPGDYEWTEEQMYFLMDKTWEEVHKGIFRKVYSLDKLNGVLPMIGLRMDCCLGNRAEVVPTPVALSFLDSTLTGTIIHYE